MNILDFYKKKQSGEKISMITCYDYTSARIVSNTAVDCILVGDSVAMVMHGYKHTLSANIDMMCFHTAAVHRGASNKFIIGDLPFLSYRKSLSDNMTAAEKIMRAGANAVKLEGTAGNLDFIKHLTESGIPVMGHLGLTPQALHMLGGYKIQGKSAEAADQIKMDALLLEKAGCFSVVLECIPKQLATEITASLSIPTIGVGAGPNTDGQVLVFQDLLGMNIDMKPKFVKSFFNGFDAIKESIDIFVNEIQTGEFPNDEHCF